MDGPSAPNPSADWREFGHTLRNWRERQELSLRALAERIRWHYTLIGKWEQGKNRPPADAVTALDTELGAGGEIVRQALRAAMADTDRSRKGTVETKASECDEDDEVERRAVMQLFAAAGAGAAVSSSAVQTVLAGVNRAIGVHEDLGLDDWERTVWEYAYLGTTGPLGTTIPDLTNDIVGVSRLLDRTRNPMVRSGLLRVSAQLTALLAGELDDVGSRSAAWQSWRTARRAADASGDRDLAVWMRAREATAAFYTGRPAHLVAQLADDAVRHADGTPSAGLAKAYEVRAFTLAAQDDEAGSRAALHDLSGVFGRLPRDVTADRHTISFSFTERNLNWARAYAHARVGPPRKASHLIEQTLATYPPGLVHGVANLQYMRALGLVRDGDVRQGLDHALASAEGLPPNAARRLITRQIVGALPEKARTLPAARELHALTTGGRTG